ncbi:sulfatase [Paenibacillus sp. WQ 127069]|uniref:Sulfatase n=1 Tax=Paenibacillus baimaensis TaxID=2982185 RepID=A0ABT2U8V6_9BACL|nr:sulfatase [Paenibacillus sp. WQ 127069]MCU6791070.1 sulfatase [Paenibacillus sp. WQ 127069]
MKKPNVLWIFGDQLRAQALGLNKDPNVRTPEIDRLAQEGVHFNSAVAGTPWCTPFRGALLTGIYPHRSGIRGNHDGLPESIPTIAHSLKANGYRTCWIGKWHLAGRNQGNAESVEEPSKDSLRIIPNHRRGGFEDWFAYENNNKPFDCWVHTDREDSTTESFRVPGYETDGLTDLLINWIEKRTRTDDEKPFFAALSVQPPHSPYEAPAEDLRRHPANSILFRPNVPDVGWVREQAGRELSGYYAAVERLDWNLGRIREALDRLGIKEHTYIVFFSDHGDMHGSHGQFRKSCPWEEAIRIPFIIGGPDRLPGVSAVTDALINHVDIAPTTLGLCGIPTPGGMEGYDYSGIVTGRVHRKQQEAPDSAYLSLVVPSNVRDGMDRPFRGIVTRDRWKYVVLEQQPWLLFNLNDDPYEQVNLAHIRRYHHIREPLHQRLLQWAAHTEDAFPFPTL